MRRWISSLALAAAAVLLAAGIIFHAAPEPQPVARRELAAGGGVRLEDGTVVYPRGRARYAVTGARRLRLDSGQLLVFVARSKKPFVVATSQAQAKAHGTAFTIAAGGETFVAVGQGRVHEPTDRPHIPQRNHDIRPGQIRHLQQSWRVLGGPAG